MELIRKPVHYTQEGKSVFDQFYLDEDYNVPEAKDDVSYPGHSRGQDRGYTACGKLCESYGKSIFSDPLRNCVCRSAAGSAGWEDTV